MRKLAVLSAALLATACGQKLDPAAVQAALPTATVLNIDAPNPNGAVAGVAPASQRVVGAVAATPDSPTPGGKAPLAVTSYLFAASVNGGVFWALAPIHWLTTVVPPTSCADDTCTWGPGSDAGELNTWMLVVTRTGDAYDYVLSGAPKAPAGSPFVPVISGRAYPGLVEHRGHGSFFVDFDEAWAGLAHPAGQAQQDFGSISVSYDARTSLQLDVVFRDGLNRENPGEPAAPNKVSAAYAFQASAAGGDLQIGFHHQPPYSPTYLDESVTLRTQWNHAGEGRADVRYLTPGFDAGFSQCWDGAPEHLMTFDGNPAEPYGAIDACRFAQADITIEVP
jgi:hypothetical protein